MPSPVGAHSSHTQYPGTPATRRPMAAPAWCILSQYPTGIHVSHDRLPDRAFQRFVWLFSCQGAVPPATPAACLTFISEHERGEERNISDGTSRNCNNSGIGPEWGSGRAGERAHGRTGARSRHPPGCQAPIRVIHRKFVTLWTENADLPGHFALSDEQTHPRTVTPERPNSTGNRHLAPVVQS